MISDPHGNGEVIHFGAPLKQAALAVVLLHGRGGSAADILGLGQAIGEPEVAYLAPQAKGNTWYPQSFLAPRQANEPFLSSALAKVNAVVRSIEEAGIPRDRIVIGGFSQGACLSTEFVKSFPSRYGGLIALTGGLIGPPGSIRSDQTSSDQISLRSAELGGMPALFASGDPDPHVPWSRVEESAAILRDMGAEVTTRRYPGRPHTVTAEEIELARELIRSAIG
ncbi:alpha/beta hydrolase [Acidicapsa acidisoli]|uniref:alpha/beta hydrolase n=1 Tax=Acidicapsa acidisoli TaxID=1615681 RepID=UPI0021E00D7A|nr:dienelactone hydrolase family protein [Acidicapsa acidisoli]